jgi:hypothetical protein
MKHADDAGEIVKTESGPEHSAPQNTEFSSSFDEFAGAFVRDEPVLLAERDDSIYGRDIEAYKFGYRMAADSRFAGNEWAQAQADLEREWKKQGSNDWDLRWAEVQAGWMKARGMG